MEFDANLVTQRPPIDFGEIVATMPEFGVVEPRDHGICSVQEFDVDMDQRAGFFNDLCNDADLIRGKCSPELAVFGETRRQVRLIANRDTPENHQLECAIQNQRIRQPRAPERLAMPLRRFGGGPNDPDNAVIAYALNANDSVQVVAVEQ